MRQPDAARPHGRARRARPGDCVKELCEHFEAWRAPVDVSTVQMLDENKWLAARHGLQGELVDLPSSDRVATKELRPAAPWKRLREHAEDLGSAAELEGDRGSGAQRQRRRSGRSWSTRPTTTCARSWPRSWRPPAPSR